MTRTRSTLAALLVALAVVPADAGLFQRKAKLDAARVKSLVEALRTETDERKRKAAVAELRDADPRAYADIIPALLHGLQRDPAPVVRVESADTLRHYKVVFPIAGMALEAAAEGDSSSLVRDAAQQALWEYHLGGYRSSKGTDGFAGQTAEPPLARPARAARPNAAVIVPVSAVKPTEVSLAPPTVAPPPVPPPPAPGPSIRTVVSSAPPAVLNHTYEPPLAKPLPPSPTVLFLHATRGPRVWSVSHLDMFTRACQKPAPKRPARTGGANPARPDVSLSAEGQADR